MSNFLGAIPALTGVVVGVVATGWAEWVRWRRGQAVRWDERRVDAYAEYAKAIKKIHMIALGIVGLGEPINREAGLEMLVQAEAHRTEVWEMMLLLADQATAHAAERWRNAVTHEVEFARGLRNDAGPDDWIVAVRSANEARDHFYEAARTSVNVGGGSVAIAHLLASAKGTRADRGQPGDL